MFPSLRAAIICCKIVTISHPIVFKNGRLEGDEGGEGSSRRPAGNNVS